MIAPVSFYQTAKPKTTADGGHTLRDAVATHKNQNPLAPDI